MKHAFVLLTVALALALVLPALADWDIGDPAKWVQLPDESPEGLYVSSHRNTWGSLLADDFHCTETGRITGIHIWGDRMAGPGVNGFNIAIYADIPAEQSPTGYSMPGELLWEYQAASGFFTSRDWTTGTWDWLEPPDYYYPSRDITCQQYNFAFDEAEAFLQSGTPSVPVVYWLSVQAYGFEPMEFAQAVSAEHWNDDAVFVVGGQQPYVGEWDELRYPEQHPYFGESIDLSFVIVGEDDTGVPEGEDEVPRSFGLRQNVPNPFNPTTTIAYDVPAGGGRVTIEVFDVAGRRVTMLVDGHETEGRRSVTWDGTDASGHTLGSGVYFYRMTASGIEETRKMPLLK